MRITILANRDLPSNFALNMLLGMLDGHELTLFLSDKVGKSNQKPALLKQLESFELSLLLRILDPLDSLFQGEIVCY